VSASAPAVHSPRRYYWLLLAAGLPLILSALYFNAGARTAAGLPMLPLDDAYIHLQYAWQAAHGQFMQYNPGDTPTSGATSLLYMLLLAAGFSLGLGKDMMPALVVFTGTVRFALSTVTLADLARRAARLLGVSEDLSALATILLFGGSGWMAWCFLSGMETGLLIALVSLALWAQVTRRMALLAGACALAVLTRPEAVLLPLVLFTAETVWRDKGEPGNWRAQAGLALALGLAALPPAVNYFYTGTFSASGMQAKSLFTLVPFHWSAVISGVGAALGEIWGRLFGGLSSDGHWHTFPLLQVAGLAGALLLARRPRTRALAVTGAAWLVLGTAATATLQTATWHHFRYQMPFYPALVLFASLAGAALAARWRSRLAPVVLLTALALWTSYSVRDFAQEYARDTQTAAQMQLPLALWLRDRTPPTARVAVHDIGLVRYFGERDTIDVVGLTTAGLAPAYRNGPGSLFEALERQRPDYYALYPDRAPPFFGTASAPALLGEELFRVQLLNYSRVTSAGDTQVVTRPDWSGAALSLTPHQPSTLRQVAGLTLADSLDVADLESEAAHAYAWWNAGETAGFPTDARLTVYRQVPTLALADGGRRLTGGERLRLQVLPATPLVLVARLHQTTPLVLAVTVNQMAAGEWRLPAVPGQWLESAFTIDPQYLTSATADIVLTVKEAPPGAAYGPSYYWAYQGALPPPPAYTPQHPSTAAFGTVAALTGFDLPAAELHPGDALNLTLYWQALAPDRADYKVFVHLIDPDDDSAAGLLAQFDAAPEAGTLPFWVWPAGATRCQDVRLDIPADTKPGTYVLLVGVYNAGTDERLPLTGAPDYGAARLLLAEIIVR